MQKHKHVHTKNFLQCDLCPSRFKQKYQLKCHLVGRRECHHSIEIQSWFCSFLGVNSFGETRPHLPILWENLRSKYSAGNSPSDSFKREENCLWGLWIQSLHQKQNESPHENAFGWKKFWGKCRSRRLGRQLTLIFFAVPNLWQAILVRLQPDCTRKARASTTKTPWNQSAETFLQSVRSEVSQNMEGQAAHGGSPQNWRICELITQIQIIRRTFPTECNFQVSFSTFYNFFVYNRRVGKVKKISTKNGSISCFWRNRMFLLLRERTTRRQKLEGENETFWKTNLRDFRWVCSFGLPRKYFSSKFIFPETFIDYKITENILRKAVICRACVDKLNEYDEHQTIANLIREELSRKHRNQDIPSPFVSIKVEIEQPPDIFLDEHKEIVQVKLEENVTPYEMCTPLQDFSMVTNEYLDNEPASSNPIDVMKDCQDKLLSKIAANKKRRKYTSRQFVKDEDLSGCQIHEIDGVKHYQCEVCKKVMQRKADFIIHLHSHRTERNFICDVSLKLFAILLHGEVIEIFFEGLRRSFKNKRRHECAQKEAHREALLLWCVSLPEQGQVWTANAYCKTLPFQTTRSS